MVTPPTTPPTGLGLWSTIDTTDPNFVREKKASGGRKEATPNAEYQVKRITEQCGPVGIGWGYHVDCQFSGNFGDPATNPCVIASVTVWAYDRANTFGPIVAINPMYLTYKSGTTFDEDAPKKAITDALTKALSHLGMSADIFMGFYDDADYVEGLRAEYSAEYLPPTPTPQTPTRPVLASPQTMIEANVVKDKPLRTVALPTASPADFWSKRVLALPVDGWGEDDFTWEPWAKSLATTAWRAPSPALLEKLLADNSAAFDAFGRAGEPEVYNRLVTALAAARRRHQPGVVEDDDGRDAERDDIPFA